MKSKKTWLAMITLILCLGVMATGIYAIKTAMLKLGGTLGFNMHNCMVEVHGTISNIAEKQKDGSYKKITKTISNAIMGAEKSDTVTTTNLDLGALEFYAGEDMIFELSFKNLSDFSVITSIELQNSNGKIIPVVNALYDTLPSAKIISIGGQASIIFALHLSDETAQMDGTEFSIIVNFEELSYVKDAQGRNCIVMGYDLETDTELLWYPFAYSTSGAEGSFVSVDATKDLKGGSYYFISEYILKKFVWGPYNANSPTFGLSYGESFIQKIVNGGVETEDSLYSTYEMRDYTIYNTITKRTLPGVNDVSYWEYYDEDEGLYNEKTFDTPATPDQTLWLLSLEEANNTSFFANDDARLAASLSEANAYWLRTPENADNIYLDNCAYAVRNNGSIGDGYIYDFRFEGDDEPNYFGIRPAFQITIG